MAPQAVLREKRVTDATPQRGIQATQHRSRAELCREAIAKLDRARQEQPADLSEDVDEAERAAVQLRDQLIEQLRQGGAPAELAGTREALSAVNMALSLIVGVEYPAAGIQRKLIEQASTALRDLLDSGRLGGE
jgi:hypothetical protein